jgi:hypothetical protein
MRYVLTLIGEEGGWEDASTEDMRAEMDRWTAFGKEAADKGVYVTSEALQDSSTATTVRLDASGEAIVTDGPFAESKEQLGGFYILECDGLDQAVEWAKKLPLTPGVIEVRPAMDYGEYGYVEPEVSQR